MRQSVNDAFVHFTSRFEGVVPWLYLDVRGLVTIAIGNLVDPIARALDLPLLHADGTIAPRDEIAAEWNTVKAHADLAPAGGLAFQAVTKLHLSPEGVANVVMRRLVLNDTQIRARFSDYETWPADAQLGILSMAWAAGSSFHFPRFEAACRALNFATASIECHMSDADNPGLRPRNTANEALFENAANVIRTGADPDVLYYPGNVPSPTAVTPGDISGNSRG